MTIETHILYFSEAEALREFSGFTVEVSHQARPNQTPSNVTMYMCGFHAIRPPSPRSSGQAFHGHLATCSTAIRPGSRSAATQGLHC
ncbi:hypothetical protein [Pseudomonas aeruginosa]|uniref:hypothetical protein n=1 Tax=Pseudomonas aeruginosa TaxID=287 RepID=UPI0024B3C9B3|nr:hypothetical protein [Pseudomonas aeruginosa]CAI9794898.1 hypothetical protein PAER4782_34935 [Pseudomonas aeruginosa]CAI9912287.1 hypothetical protein PAER4782_34935 [Pseudomonas aeruginosa]